MVNVNQQMLNQQQQQQLAARKLAMEQQQLQQQQQQQQPQQSQPQNINFAINPTNPNLVMQQNMPQQMQQQPQQSQQMNVPVAAAPGIIQQQATPVAGAAPPARERQVIWQGVLEWQEKTRDPQKLPRHVPCQVSASVTNGESEVSVLLLYLTVFFLNCVLICIYTERRNTGRKSF